MVWGLGFEVQDLRFRAQAHVSGLEFSAKEHFMCTSRILQGYYKCTLYHGYCMGVNWVLVKEFTVSYHHTDLLCEP